uniref:Prostate stem cell antigen-like n=1 Tax=Geotrypetes seraphini TaxID=260995 RepID=A0A6P8Q0D8_GEOSA|nr:prostate stem cell antigen-like [Geotrypetes seraphini]
MKTFLLSLLAAALCLHPADSLKCYTCESAIELKNSKCLIETNCTSEAMYCMTTHAIAHEETAINKRCAAECTSRTVVAEELTVSDSCCQTDLCNFNGDEKEAGERKRKEVEVSAAVSVRIGVLTLVIAVGFFGSLLSLEL